jgi:hypothetical protein
MMSLLAHAVNAALAILCRALPMIAITLIGKVLLYWKRDKITLDNFLNLNQVR